MNWGTFVIAALLCITALPSIAGEIIGNTYVSDKFGPFEVTSPDGKWSIKDEETASQAQLVKLELKDPLNGHKPNFNVFSVPNPGGTVTLDYFLRTQRESFEKAGIEVGALEVRRFAGKKVPFFSTSMTRSNRTLKADVYVFEGQNAIFFAQCIFDPINHAAHKPLCDEVAETVKY